MASPTTQLIERVTGLNQPIEHYKRTTLPGERSPHPPLALSAPHLAELLDHLPVARYRVLILTQAQ